MTCACLETSNQKIMFGLSLGKVAGVRVWRVLVMNKWLADARQTSTRPQNNVAEKPTDNLPKN